MKILLINPTIRDHHPPYSFPVGLGILAAIMRSQGHEIHVYDQNALRTSNTDMFRALKKLKEVDVIGTGGLITTYAHLKKIVPGVREVFPNAKIIIGGGVTVEPEIIFKHLSPDFCVHGEGEHTFPKLCAALVKKEIDLSSVDGISFLKNGELVRNNPRAIERNLNLFPMPAYALFPSEIYFKNNVIKNLVGLDVETERCATLMWSRGCPNKCTFCWRMMGQTVRFRSVELVMEEIGFLRSKYDVDSYTFIDECINASKTHSREFASQLIESGYAAPWYSHARVNNFDEKLASLFRQSGCVGLNFGIESGSPEMLEVMNKRANPEQASSAVKVAQDTGIESVCTFIIGMPGETKSTVKDSIRWI